MNITPYISAKDLSEMLGVSIRTARRLMESVVKKRVVGRWALDENLLKVRNKCLLAYEVRHFRLKRTDIQSHFECVLNEPPSMRLRSEQKIVKAGEQWHKRILMFENSPEASFAVKRFTYSYVDALDGESGLGVFGFGFTLFPSLLFCRVLDGYYGRVVKECKSFKSLEGVLYDVEVQEELLGYLGRFCGRRKPVNSVVVVEEMEKLSEAAFYKMLDGLAGKLDRKRCLVFMPEAMVPEGLRNLERIRGFRKLKGSGFYLGGGIGKWVDVRFGLRYV